MGGHRSYLEEETFSPTSLSFHLSFSTKWWLACSLGGSHDYFAVQLLPLFLHQPLHPSLDGCLDDFYGRIPSIFSHSISCSLLFCHVQLSHCLLPLPPQPHPPVIAHSVTFHPLHQNSPVVPNIKDILLYIIYYHIHDASPSPARCCAIK